MVHIYIYTYAHYIDLLFAKTLKPFLEVPLKTFFLTFLFVLVFWDDSMESARIRKN